MIWKKEEMRGRGIRIGNLSPENSETLKIIEQYARSMFIAAPLVAGAMGSATLLSTGQYVLAIVCASASSASAIVLVATISLADWILDCLSKRRGICATCGSEERKPHPHQSDAIEKYKIERLYDEKGRVIALANPQVIEKSDIEVRWRVYKILYEEFGGRHPDEVKKSLESEYSKETSTQSKLEEFEGKWDAKTISTVKDYCKVVRHLPPGMKSDENSEKGRNEGKRSAGR